MTLIVLQLHPLVNVFWSFKWNELNGEYTHSEGEGHRSHSPLEGPQSNLLQGGQSAGVPDMDAELQGLHTR